MLGQMLKREGQTKSIVMQKVREISIIRHNWVKIFIESYLDIKFKDIYHSMARVNLDKSEELVTNTTAASKYMLIPKRSRICINQNPPFQTSLHKIFNNCF